MFYYFYFHSHLARMICFIKNHPLSLTDESVLESAENVKAVLMGAYSWTGHYHYLTIGQISLDVMGNDLKISNGNYHYSTYNWLMYSYAYQQYPREFDGWWSAYSP